MGSEIANVVYITLYAMVANIFRNIFFIMKNLDKRENIYNNEL